MLEFTLKHAKKLTLMTICTKSPVLIDKTLTAGFAGWSPLAFLLMGGKECGNSFKVLNTLVSILKYSLTRRGVSGRTNEWLLIE